MWYECKKIIVRKNIFLVVAALLANFLVLSLAASDSDNILQPKIYRQIFLEMKNMTNQQKYEHLKAMTEDKQNLNTLADYRKQELLVEFSGYAETVAEYEEYLNTMEENMEQRVSISGADDTFFQKNAKKMLDVYRTLRGTAVSFESYKGLELADVTITNILMLFLVIFFSIEALASEKEGGLLTILRCCKKGRSNLLFNKILALGIVGMSVSGLFMLENLLFGSAMYGLGNLTRPLQSLPGFAGCYLKISVITFLIYVWLLKSMALILTEIFVLLLMVHTYQMPVALCGCVAVGGIAYMCYFGIHVQSGAAILHYVNSVALLKAVPLLNSEVNLNVFGMPVSPLMVGIVAFIFAYLLMFGCAIHRFQRSIEAKKIPLSSKRRTKQRRYAASILYGEAYKLLVTKKGFLGLICIMGIQLFIFSNAIPYKPPQENCENYLLMELHGEAGAEKDAWIQTERMRQDLLSQETGYSLEKEVLELRIVPLQEQLRVVKEETGHAQYIHQTGYEKLFGVGERIRDHRNTMIFVTLLVCVLSTYVTMEKTGNMKALIEPTKAGWKQVRKKKRILAVIYSCIGMVLIWLPDFISLFHTYRLQDWNAPMNWLLAFQEFPNELTIGMYLIMLVIVRILGAAVTGLLIVWISERCSKNTVAFGVSTFVLLVPAILTILQVPYVEQLTFSGLLDGNVFLQGLFRILPN